MALPDREQVVFTSRAQLRAWLAGNAAASPGIWVLYHPAAGDESALSYDDLVEEALCFGWIDATTRRHDSGARAQLLTPRRPGSTWARTNKERVERLTAAGLMTEAGLRAVDVAKTNSSWEALESVERDEVPQELTEALDAVPDARTFFDALPPGVRRQHVWFVVSAKRPETRARRVAAIVTAAADGRRAVT